MCYLKFKKLEAWYDGLIIMGTLLNGGGRYVIPMMVFKHLETPTMIVSMENSDDEVLERKQILIEEFAFTLNHILFENIN